MTFAVLSVPRWMRISHSKSGWPSAPLCVLKGKPRWSSGATDACPVRNLSEALGVGLQQAGLDVIDLGVVATPLVYFGTHMLGAQSGVMVTGSHNPPDYNGFKMVLAGEAIYGETILALHRAIVSGSAAHATVGMPVGGYLEQVSRQEYLARIADDVKFGAADEDCGRLWRWRGRRVCRRSVPHARLRGAGIVLRSGRHFSGSTIPIRPIRKICRMSFAHYKLDRRRSAWRSMAMAIVSV